MYAVLNHSPDVIAALLRHPVIDLTIKNGFDKTIIYIVKENTNVSLKIRMMVEFAYEKQVNPAAGTQQTVAFHLEKIRKLVIMEKFSAQTAENLKHQLDVFSEDFSSALEGRDPSTIGMSALHRQKLQGNRVFLLEELQDDFLDYMHQDYVITLDKLEEIRTCQTRRQRMTKILSILPYCGEQAYPSFIAALRATNKGYVADMLEAYDPSSAPASDASSDSSALVPVTSPASEGETDDKAEFDRLFLQCMHAYAKKYE